MQRSAIETCSPVESSTSISRASGASQRPRARSTSRSVLSPIAETTTTTCVPRLRCSCTRSATRRIRSSEPTEVPPYFWTMRDKVGPASGTKAFAHPGLDTCERGIERSRVGAACLRHVGTSTAAAANLLCDVADQLAGLDLAGLVLRHAGDQEHLVRALDRRKHHDRGLELALQLIHGIAQRLRVRAVDSRRQHLHAVDL